jgi:hypothetical protein
MLSGLKKIRFGAWFGVLALAAQLYLPIHLVHLVERCANTPATAAPAVTHHHHSIVHAAAQSPHDSSPGSHPVHAQPHCSICSMLHAVAAITLSDSIEPHHAILLRVGSSPVMQSCEPAFASPASYASRAPPPSLG